MRVVPLNGERFLFFPLAFPVFFPLFRRKREILEEMFAERFRHFYLHLCVLPGTKLDREIFQPLRNLIFLLFHFYTYFIIIPGNDELKFSSWKTFLQEELIRGDIFKI